jgi:hypothetical protein
MIMALLELQFAEADRAKTFRCTTCPASIQKLRRCHEERFDFTEADAPFWPIQITKGGELYNFCPGRATRDFEAVSLYNAIMLTAETGALWEDGGISSQPAWYMDLVSAYVPLYNELRFSSRARMVLGDGKKQGATDGNIKRPAKVHPRG